MILKKYYEAKKRTLFPEINDWTKSYNDKRYSKNVAGMSYHEWFWFHTTAYQLVHYGMEVIFSMFFASAALLFWYWKISFLMWVWIGFAIYMIIRLINKIKNHEYTKNTNFYDVFLREWK